MFAGATTFCKQVFLTIPYVSSSAHESKSELLRNSSELQETLYDEATDRGQPKRKVQWRWWRWYVQQWIAHANTIRIVMWITNSVTTTVDMNLEIDVNEELGDHDDDNRCPISVWCRSGNRCREEGYRPTQWNSIRYANPTSPALGGGL